MKDAICTGWKVQDTGLDFDEANLAGTDFSGIHLRRGGRPIRFRLAKLNRTIFDRATMIDVDMNGSNLNHASFKSSDLTGTSFRMERRSQRETSMVGADFSGARIRDSFFTDAILSNAQFTNPDQDEKIKLERVDFDNATLDGADFTNANLVGVDFTDASLIGAVFEGATLTDVTCPNGDRNCSIDQLLA